MESISAIGPSEKKLLMMVRKLPGDELNKIRNYDPYKLNYLVTWRSNREVIREV